VIPARDRPLVPGPPRSAHEVMVKCNDAQRAVLRPREERTRPCELGVP
jgi:hypothetical protein